MTHLSTLKNLSRCPLCLALCLILISEATGAAPDPLPPPRAKTAPQKPVLPDAPAGTSQPTTTLTPGIQAEVPKPEGRPRQAAEPSESDAGAAAKDVEKDEKKDPPPRDGRCDRCGGGDCVRNVCVPRMTEKEIKKVCWDSKCEDFCVPGRSLWCGTVGKKDDCGCWTHGLWKPTCAELRTRVVPVRKETKRKVPAVEWSVEERCACCRRRPCDLSPPSPRDPKQAPKKITTAGCGG